MAIIYNRDGTTTLISDTDETDIATLEAGMSADDINQAIDAFFNGRTWLASSLSAIKSWFIGGASVKN